MNLDARKIALGTAWALTLTLGILAGRQSASLPSEEEAAAELIRAHGGTRLLGEPGHSSHPGPATNRTTPPKRPRTPEEHRTALHAALSDADQLARTRQLLRLVDSLAPDEFQGVVDAFRADGFAKIRPDDYALLLHAWVQADPYGAVEYLEESEPSGRARESAITAWAAIDPYAAAAWVDGREDNGRTNNWSVGLLRGIASNDPDLARQTLEGLEPGHTRSSGMSAILPYVLQNGFQYTSEWIANIQDESLQRGTARSAARDLTRSDPEQAGAWINQMVNVAARRDASEEVSDEWAKVDLEAARKWAETLPEDTRTEAAEGIARQMARQDPARTANWLDSLGDNPDLDGARRIFLSEASTLSPEIALDNVYTLSRESDQSRMYSHILNRWSSDDKAAAQAWVVNNSSSLPDNLVKRYTKPQK